jgi:phosphopantothenoylcysteine decarboxylase / phosphopantothenate---cysteine ligase
MHPSRDIIGTIDQRLAGRKIVLCVTGSVAAVRTVDLARLLMRHGAEVYPVMSKWAAKIVGPQLLHWATGHKPVLRLTGRIEHVSLAGNVEGKADLVLVAPATANTIGKIAAGIDDTPVTSVVTTGLGEGIPLMIVPAMHESMYNHPFVRENLAKLEANGVKVLQAVMEEGKAKIASVKHISDAVCGLLEGKGPLKGVDILITSGSTLEYIDPVRIITNKSSGRMGSALAAEAIRHGANVKMIRGRMTASVPPRIRTRDVETTAQMEAAVLDELDGGKVKIFISVAAVSDWTVKQKSDTKIPAQKTGELNLTLVPTPKIIDGIRKKHPDIFLVAFRASTGLSEKDLVQDAFERLQKCGADLIVANDVTREGSGFDVKTNEVYVIDKEKNVVHVPLMSKEKVAGEIFRVILAKFKTGE